MGLFVVSTPIGNLEDITIRAIKTLFMVDILLCEDTRHTGILLTTLSNRYPSLLAQPSSKPQLIPFHEHNEHKVTPKIVGFLQSGKSVALVSDAGTPLLSDPGYLLVKECVKKDISIQVVPGPSSILTALVASGLPTYPFRFLGYPPEKSAKRLSFFRGVKLFHPGGVIIATPRETVIFFASPHKVVQILEDFIEVFGNIPVVVARELTKVHEEFIRESALEVIKTFRENQPKGELVILFNI